MARNLEKYRFRDGQTYLSAKEFNDRFFDVDARLHVLETLKVTWEDAVTSLQNLGLERVDAVIMPLLDQAMPLIEELLVLQAQLEAWMENNVVVANTVAFTPPPGMTATNVQAAINDVDSRIKAVITSANTVAGRVTDIEAWQTSHTHTESQITDLSHNAVKLQGRNVDNGVPSDGQCLQWNTAASKWTFGSPVTGFTSMQVFTSSGTFTVPSGVTRVLVEVLGGGGGGGRNADDSKFGAGGGGGGYARKLVTGLSAGGTVAVTRGDGGAKAESGGTSGSSGGSSSFGVHVSASGGAGGSSAADGLVAGGIGSSGDINLPGGYGESHSTMNQSKGGDTQFGFGGIRRYSSLKKSAVGYGSGGYGATYSTIAEDGRPGIVIVYY
jgi:hypothetical protein